MENPRMIRPPWERILHFHDHVACTCGQVLHSDDQRREHWQLGHFDVREPGWHASAPSEHHRIIHDWILSNVTEYVVPGDEGNMDALLYNLLALLYDGPDFEAYQYLDTQDARLRQWGIPEDGDEE